MFPWNRSIFQVAQRSRLQVDSSAGDVDRFPRAGEIGIQVNGPPRTNGAALCILEFVSHASKLRIHRKRRQTIASTLLNSAESASASRPKFRSMHDFSMVANFSMRTVEGSFKPASFHSERTMSPAVHAGWLVMGTTSRSSSPKSSATRTGRRFRPSPLENVSRARRTSPCVNLRGINPDRKRRLLKRTVAITHPTKNASRHESLSPHSGAPRGSQRNPTLPAEVLRLGPALLKDKLCDVHGMDDTKRRGLLQ